MTAVLARRVRRTTWPLLDTLDQLTRLIARHDANAVLCHDQAEAVGESDPAWEGWIRAGLRHQVHAEVLRRVRDHRDATGLGGVLALQGQGVNLR